MEEIIKIILVDDEELFRSGIKFILDRESKINVIFEASNGSELLEYLGKANILPDIILMDLKMPTLNGVETTKILNKEYPELKVIALSSYDSKSFIVNMIKEGVSSYIIKNTTPLEMIETINKVYIKGFHYNSLTLKVIKEEESELGKLKTKSVLDSNFLTKREKEVLELICLEYNASEIADKLCISPRTVEGYRANMLEKTNSKNVAGLIVFAILNDLIPLESVIK
jgi:DNA-binding NarL/FixJ family response regulator